MFVYLTEAFEEASILMGGIDIVINNAGILDERRWEREIAVNIVSEKRYLLRSVMYR